MFSIKNPYVLDMAMELRHFRYFIAVAEEGNITRAAQRLRMQQPPLSQQIKAIERELDVQLFHREPRGVELTDAGRTFLEKARSILGDVERAFATTRSTARGEQGQVCIGFTTTGLFHSFVPRVIVAFREAFPLVSLTMDARPSLELVERLQNAEVDVAFIRTEVTNTEGLVVNPLMEEPMVVALPSGHILARRGGRDSAVLLKDLAAETFIVYARELGPGLFNATIAACHAAGFNPRLGQETPNSALAINLVAAGLGISIVQASMRRMQLDGVTYRHLKAAPRN
jgi:DNA-binding transcriptional LysR family regulator